MSLFCHRFQILSLSYKLYDITLHIPTEIQVKYLLGGARGRMEIFSFFGFGEMIKNVFKMESGQSTLKNNFSQKIFVASCEAFKTAYSHENSCENIHRVAV